MRGYPQFSFWILIALAKICFFHIVVNRAKKKGYAKRNPNISPGPEMRITNVH